MVADSTPTNDPDAARWHRDAVNPHSDLPQTPVAPPRPAVWPKPTGPCQCPRCEPCEAAERAALSDEISRTFRAFSAARAAYNAAFNALAAFDAAAQARRTP